MKLTPNLLHGTVTKSAAIGEFILTETAYSRNAELGRHSHEKAYFCFVLQGNFTERYKKENRRCAPSSVIFHPPGEFHSDIFGEYGALCFNFQVENLWLERVNKYSPVLESSAEFNGGLMAKIFLQIYREFGRFDSLSTLAVEGLALEAGAAAARQSKAGARRRNNPPAWLKITRELLHDKFSESLTLTTVAELSGVHPVHLARTFRLYHDCSVVEYLRRLRIGRARGLLSTSDKSISDIAYDLGFSSQSHFSTIFKRETGLTPVEYRKFSAKS